MSRKGSYKQDGRVREKLVPLQEEVVLVTPEMAKEMLSGEMGCAWKGCEASYKGTQMPPGWRCIGIYTKDILDGQIDGVLCPAHVAELGKYLMMGFRLVAVADEANRSTD